MARFRSRLIRLEAMLAFLAGVASLVVKTFFG